MTLEVVRTQHMAKAFPVAHKRGTTFIVNPADLLVDESTNGRAFPYTASEIFQKAKTLKKDGQLQPIIVQRLPGNKVMVVAGTGRTLGAIYLNEKDPDFKENPFLLEAVVRDDEGMDAFAMNVTENFQHKNLSPVDIAHNIALSDAKVAAQVAAQEGGGVPTEKDLNDAALYLFGLENTGDNRKWLDRHRDISKLPMGIKRKIHTRTLAVDAALEYVGMDADLAEQVQAKAEEISEGKKVTKTRVRKAKAAAATGKAGAKTADKPINHALNKAQVVQFFSHQVENNKRTSIKTLANGILGYISGDLLELDFLKILDKCTVPNPAKA